MPGFNQSAVVQIYEGDQALGSGYALGNGRVLTARHVVGERAQVWVRSEGQADGFAMAVAWRGTADTPAHDVAILRSVRSDAPAGAPSVAWFTGDPRKQDWFARGFPAALGNASVAVSGKIEEGQDAGSNPCQLSVNVAPDAANLWKGMSGAAVFVEQRLFAVLRTASGYFSGRSVAAVPVAALLVADEELREAVGLPKLDEDRERWRSDVIDAVVHIIDSTADLRARLGKVAVWKSFARDGSKTLAAAIVAETSPVALVDALYEAMTWLDPGPEGARFVDPIRAVLWLVLPLVGGPCVTFERESEHLWVMNVGFDWMVEYRVAYDDRRPVQGPEWRSSKSLPRPTALVPCSQAEAPEGGADGLPRVADAARAIMDRSNPIEMDDRVLAMARYIVTATDARAGEGLLPRDVIDQARMDVALAAKPTGRNPGRTYYTILRREEEGEGLPVIAELIADRLGIRVIEPRMQPADRTTVLSFRSSLSRFFKRYCELIGAAPT